jgi:hypothetical protein
LADDVGGSARFITRKEEARDYRRVAPRSTKRLRGPAFAVDSFAPCPTIGVNGGGAMPDDRLAIVKETAEVVEGILENVPVYPDARSSSR